VDHAPMVRSKGKGEGPMGGRGAIQKIKAPKPTTKTNPVAFDSDPPYQTLRGDGKKETEEALLLELSPEKRG